MQSYLPPPSPTFLPTHPRKWFARDPKSACALGYRFSDLTEVNQYFCWSLSLSGAVVLISRNRVRTFRAKPFCFRPSDLKYGILLHWDKAWIVSLICLLFEQKLPSVLLWYRRWFTNRAEVCWYTWERQCCKLALTSSSFLSYRKESCNSWSHQLLMN